MPSMVRNLGIVLAVLGLAASGALASGGSEEPEPSASPPSPADQAAEHYNAGLENREEAWRLSKKAANDNLPAEKRQKLDRKIRDAYDRAIGEFTAAVTIDPRMHKAYGSLGYAYRQTGDYRAALEAYDKALQLAPDYAEAVEYRAEAYLGLNRVDDAKAAYDTLQKLEPKLAAELLGAMRAWVAERRRDSAADVGALDAFERWVDDRHEGKNLPVASSLGKARSW